MAKGDSSYSTELDEATRMAGSVVQKRATTKTMSVRGHCAADSSFRSVFGNLSNCNIGTLTINLGASSSKSLEVADQIELSKSQ